MPHCFRQRSDLRPLPAPVLVLALALALGCETPKIAPPPGAVAPPGRPDAAADVPAVDAIELPDMPGLPPQSLDAATGPEVMACAAERIAAESTPVDLVFLVDQSPSMLYKIGDRTKWELAQEAFRRFLSDPGSAGLNVGVQFFPVRAGSPPCAGADDCGFPLLCQGGRCRYPIGGLPSCAAGDYEMLAVDPGALPGARDPLLAAIGRTPNANWALTPLGPAMQGVQKTLRARAAAQPGRRIALVLVGDGVPEGCLAGWTGVARIEEGVREQQRMTPSILTFVIGLFSDAEGDVGGPAALARYAAAGGTEAPFVIRPPGDVTAGFLAALDKIRAASLPCEYLIPASKLGTIDFGKVNLHVKLPGMEYDVPYVARRERCDDRGGWYYDVDPATGAQPGRVIACPATCQRWKAAVGQAEVQLTFGCRTQTLD